MYYKKTKKKIDTENKQKSDIVNNYETIELLAKKNENINSQMVLKKSHAKKNF